MALQIPKSYTGQYGGKSYIGLPKQTADLLANPPQIKPVVKPINPIPQEKPVYDPNRPVITSDTILQQNYENLNPQGIYNPYANVLPEEELRAKAEQSLRSRMQPEIDAIGQYYLTVRQQAEKDAQARMGRTMAMEAAAGRITSPSSTSNISETEQANTQQLNAIEAEKQMKIANILGKISSQAVEEAKAKRLEEMGKIDKSIEIRKKLFEESKARLADLSGVGLKFSELKTKSPDLYNSLLKGGMSDLEIDAYLTGKNDAEIQTQKINDNQVFVIKKYKNGNVETSIVDARVSPNETLVYDKDGKPYAESVDAQGNKIKRLLTSGFNQDQYGTGSIGEYNFYAEQEKNAGRTPVSYNEYQNMDANRKAKIAGAGTSGLTPNQKINAEMSLYSKVQAATKLQTEIVRNVNGVNALWKSYQANPKQGLNAISQGIITSYGKILDPGSVVRESEYARTPEGISLVNKAQGYIEKMQRGGAGLTENDLKEFVNAINVLSKNAQSEINDQIKIAEKYGKQYGLDTSLIGGKYVDTGNNVDLSLDDEFNSFINQ